MKMLIKVLVLASLAGVAPGCAFVTSANPGLTTATGDTWYTKDKMFIIHLGTDVYYCPKDGDVCYLADIIE